MRRPAPAKPRYSAQSIRARIRRLVTTLEFYSTKFFGEDNCPFVQGGAYALATLTVCVLSGLVLLFAYSPLLERALSSTETMSRSPVWALMKTVHRASAQLFVLIILFHGLRNWATERFRGPRARQWMLGLAALPIAGILGWSGLSLAWDQRAMVLVAWGRELIMSVDRWPVLGWLHAGWLISRPIFSAVNESQLLLRIFALHVGCGMLLLALVMWHLKRVTPPRVRLTLRSWLVLLFLILIVARSQVHYGPSAPFNPFSEPEFVFVDAILTFPLLFYPLLGASLLSAVAAVVWLVLFLAPRFEPPKILAACVDEARCTGCRQCLEDCPYGAVVMVSLSASALKEERETVRVLPQYCTGCGICVGACAEHCVDLPDMTSADVVAKIDSVLASAGTDGGAA